jgi:hypothetical protein
MAFFPPVIVTNSRKIGGFLQFRASGGFAYFQLNCGGFLEFTQKLYSTNLHPKLLHSRKIGGFLQFHATGGFAYFQLNCGGFLEFTQKLCSTHFGKRRDQFLHPKLLHYLR